MFRFQALLIIFLATIRLQSWGDAVCDLSVGAADSSPQGEGSSGCTRGCGASGTDESVPYEICGGCGRN